ALPAGAVGPLLRGDAVPGAPDGPGPGRDPIDQSRPARGGGEAAFARPAAPAGERARAVPARARGVSARAAPAGRGASGSGGGPALPVPRALSLQAYAAGVCLAPTARLKRG